MNNLLEKMNKICELIYNSIAKIITSYNIINKSSSRIYSNKVVNFSKSYIDENTNDIRYEYITKTLKQSLMDMDWLYFVRELIIFLLKKYATLYEESFHIITNDSIIKTKLFILYTIFIMILFRFIIKHNIIYM